MHDCFQKVTLSFSGRRNSLVPSPKRYSPCSRSARAMAGPRTLCGLYSCRAAARMAKAKKSRAKSKVWRARQPCSSFHSWCWWLGHCFRSWWLSSWITLLLPLIKKSSARFCVSLAFACVLDCVASSLAVHLSLRVVHGNVAC